MERDTTGGGEEDEEGASSEEEEEEEKARASGRMGRKCKKNSHAASSLHAQRVERLVRHVGQREEEIGSCVCHLIVCDLSDWIGIE